MRKRLWLGAAATALAASMLVGECLAEKRAQADRTELMRRKLVYSQDLLRGLALEDFESIAKNALDLNQLSLEAEWTEAVSPLYGFHGNEFRAACDRIKQSAVDRNLDGAALHYVQLVMACVNCHKATRGGEGIASLGFPSSLPTGD